MPPAEPTGRQRSTDVLAWRGPGVAQELRGPGCFCLSFLVHSSMLSTSTAPEGRGVCPRHTGFEALERICHHPVTRVAGLEVFPSPFTEASRSVCVLEEEFWALL